MKIFLEFLINIFYIYSKIFGTLISGFLAPQVLYYMEQSRIMENNPDYSAYMEYGSFFDSILAGLILGIFLSVISLMTLPSFSKSTIKFKLLFSGGIIGLNLLMGYSAAFFLVLI